VELTLKPSPFLHVGLRNIVPPPQELGNLGTVKIFESRVSETGIVEALRLIPDDPRREHNRCGSVLGRKRGDFLYN
jgi:hypothetical protein